MIRGARRPLLVAGGGVIYSEATEALRAVRRGDRHPGRRHPGRQGRHPLGPPAGRRRGRVDRVAGGQRAGPRRRRGDRRRHPLQRLHHRVPHRVPAPGRAVRQPQRGRARRGQARRGDADRRRPRRAGRAHRRAGRLPGRRRPTPERHRAPVDEWNQVVDDAYHLGHQPLPAQTEVLGRAERDHRRPATSSCRRPGRCPATCRCCGGPQDPKQYHVEYALLLHGLRDRRRARDQDGRPGAGGVRPGRRRLLPDDGRRRSSPPSPRASSSSSSSCRTTGSPRSARCRSRSARSGSAPTTATATRAPACSTATSCRSTWPPTPQSLGADVIRVTTIEEFREALRTARAAERHHRDPHRNRPTRSRPAVGQLVGRTRLRSGRAGQHAAGTQELRDAARPGNAPYLSPGGGS